MFCNTEKLSGISLGADAEIKSGSDCGYAGKNSGQASGIIFHTIGQRGGLGISHATPLYVVSIDPDKNRIVVGEKKDLMAKGLVAGDMNMLVKSWPGQVYAKSDTGKRGALRSNSRKRQTESNICRRTGSNHTRPVRGFL